MASGLQTRYKMRDTRLANEPEGYLSKREELRSLEIESMKLRERVAEARRLLPQGPAVKDYVFLEGPADLSTGDLPTRSVRLSELFTGSDRPLVIYHLMYGKRQTTPCPMCTLWVDGYNGVAHHIAQRVDFAIVAAADPPALRAHARRRAGRTCASSAPARTAASNTISAARTGKAIRIPPYPYSPKTRTGRCVISTPPTLGWIPTSRNAASTC